MKFENQNYFNAGAWENLPQQTKTICLKVVDGTKISLDKAFHYNQHIKVFGFSVRSQNSAKSILSYDKTPLAINDTVDNTFLNTFRKGGTSIVHDALPLGLVREHTKNHTYYPVAGMSLDFPKSTIEFRGNVADLEGGCIEITFHFVDCSCLIDSSCPNNAQIQY